MICLIDNYDSFTYNIVHLLEKITSNVIVLKNDCNINNVINLNPTHVIISPGAGHPLNSNICVQVLHYFKEKIPILGICLGHQIIAQYFGATIGHAKNVAHGKKSLICNNHNGLFYNLPDKFFAARYHSLAALNTPFELELQAWDAEDMEIMAIKHKSLPIYGIQFHPESFMTEFGENLLYNFITLQPYRVIK